MGATYFINLPDTSGLLDPKMSQGQSSAIPLSMADRLCRPDIQETIDPQIGSTLLYRLPTEIRTIIWEHYFTIAGQELLIVKRSKAHDLSRRQTSLYRIEFDDENPNKTFIKAKELKLFENSFSLSTRVSKIPVSERSRRVAEMQKGQSGGDMPGDLACDLQWDPAYKVVSRKALDGSLTPEWLLIKKLSSCEREAFSGICLLKTCRKVYVYMTLPYEYVIIVASYMGGMILDTKLFDQVCRNTFYAVPANPFPLREL